MSTTGRRSVNVDGGALLPQSGKGTEESDDEGECRCTILYS